MTYTTKLQIHEIYNLKSAIPHDALRSYTLLLQIKKA